MRSDSPRPVSYARYVLIDDDETYCRMVERIARHLGMEMDTFPSLEAMGSVGRLGDYDAAIVDFDLGNMNGVEIAAYLPSLFGPMPLVLISGCDRAPEFAEKWPSSVKCFLNKAEGTEAVLLAARQAVAGVSVDDDQGGGCDADRDRAI